MVNVELYGILQEVAGTRSLQIELTDKEVTVDRVLAQLRSEVPALSPHLPRVACAQGEALVRRSDPVDAGQSLVLLPPVSGGATTPGGAAWST